MSHSNGIISAPIDVLGDVSTVLGAANGDVATLCSHPNINKWSKHKPTRYNSYSQPSSVTWKADDGNCGLRFTKTYSTIADLVTNGLDGGMTQWVYEPPRPGTDWCRITDFEGYCHTAKPPFGSVHNQTITLGAGKTWISCESPITAASSTQLSLTDLTNTGFDISKSYFGILLVSADRSRRWLVTRTTTVAQTNSWDVEFGETLRNYPGAYNAYPVFSSVVFTPDTQSASGKIIFAEEGAGTVTLAAQSESYPTNVDCRFKSGDGNYLTYDVSITNNASARNFTNVVLQVAADTSGTGATTAVSFGNIGSIAKGGVWRKEGRVLLSRSDASTYFKFARLSYSGSGSLSWVRLTADIATGPVVIA